MAVGDGDRYHAHAEVFDAELQKWQLVDDYPFTGKAFILYFRGTQCGKIMVEIEIDRNGPSLFRSFSDAVHIYALFDPQKFSKFRLFS